MKGCNVQMAELIRKNNQEIIINKSGIEWNCITEQHTNKLGEVLESIGCLDTMMESIIDNTDMEQEDAGRVVNLLVQLFNSGTIYCVNDDGEYYVKPEIATTLDETLGIGTFKGMTNDESIAFWGSEKLL